MLGGTPNNARRKAVEEAMAKAAAGRDKVELYLIGRLFDNAPGNGSTPSA